MGADQRVLERNVDGAVAVFYVEDNGIAAHLVPASDNLYPAVASCHQSGEVYCPYFKVLRNNDGLF